jgi:glycosyltransferase involved in cell wall biosynthesis
LSTASASETVARRVLVAHSFYRLPGGEDRYVMNQLDLLAGRHAVELLGRQNRDLSGGVDTLSRMTFGRTVKREVDEAITRFRPDLVHLHNAYPSLGPAVHSASERHGVPLVMTVHNFRLRCPNGYMFTEGAPCRRCETGVYAHAMLHHCFASRAQSVSYATALWIHRFVLKLERKVALFIAPSEFVRDRLLQWGIPGERVRVVRNFTGLSLGDSEPGDYGVYLGRLSSEKGLDVLVRALERAGDPPFRFVGDGPERAALETRARELGLSRAIFAGQLPHEEVTPLLRRSRYIVFSSVWDENAPIAALEAMASGRPLLVTRTGGLPELVRGGEGLACETGDEAGLASNIRKLVEDDDLCRRMGGRALRRARAELSPASHLRGLEEAYASVLGD